MTKHADSESVTRADIEDKLREIRAGTDAGRDAAQGPGMAAGGMALAVLAAYALGRRRGRKRRTVVEIRRV